MPACISNVSSCLWVLTVNSHATGHFNNELSFFFFFFIIISNHHSGVNLVFQTKYNIFFMDNNRNSNNDGNSSTNIRLKPRYDRVIKKLLQMFSGSFELF